MHLFDGVSYLGQLVVNAVECNSAVEDGMRDLRIIRFHIFRD